MSVTSFAVPPVLKLAVSFKNKISPIGKMELSVRFF